MSCSNRVVTRLIVLLFSSGLFGESLRIHLLFTNDIHGSIHEGPARFINPEFAPDLSGGAGAFAYVNKIRQEAETKGEAVLLTDAGNVFQGTPLGTSDGGETMIRWMNWMEYDAFTPGVKDFDQGKENLTQLAAIANFPFLSANMDGLNGTLPYLIKDLNGIQIGIIGLMTPELKKGVLPENFAGISVGNPLDKLNTLIPEVRSKGADLIFVLAHLGLPYDREEEYELMLNRLELSEKILITNALELAHYSEGVDIIITGGISKGYDTPWQDPLTHTLVLQNYGNLTGIGHLTIEVDKEVKTITNYSFPIDRGMMLTLFTDDIWPDLEMADSIRQWVQSVKENSDFNPDQSKEQIRTNPSPECPDQWPADRNVYNIPPLGKTNGLDVITWNMERFPLAGDTTLKVVSEIIRDLNVDIIGIQEVQAIGEFAEMMSWLPEYDFILSQQSSFMDQAIIYRKDVLIVLNQQEPFAFDDYFFAGRPPLVVDFLYRCGETEMEITIVNFHLKCCGDGLYRRQQSMKQLHTFLRDRIDLGLTNIIVIGDWNDQIQDEGIYQSFRPFVNDKNHFRFVTDLIVDDPNQQSYPTWPSFLDHILIAESFFDSFKSNGVIRSVNIDEWIGGWEVYESTISDHRPILLHLPFN
tara:strand:- start:1118 stop:3037 length:1920 start_codon:yes stop_codon:yes gene_type:complete